MLLRLTLSCRFMALSYHIAYSNLHLCFSSEFLSFLPLGNYWFALLSMSNRWAIWQLLLENCQNHMQLCPFSWMGANSFYYINWFFWLKMLVHVLLFLWNCCCSVGICWSLKQNLVVLFHWLGLQFALCSSELLILCFCSSTSSLLQSPFFSVTTLLVSIILTNCDNHTVNQKTLVVLHYALFS